MGTSGMPDVADEFCTCHLRTYKGACPSGDPNDAFVSHYALAQEGIELPSYMKELVWLR